MASVPLFMSLALPRLFRSSSKTLRHHSASTKAAFRVGFIGLGNMGLPMALNLAKGANVASVIAFDSNETACANATNLGFGKLEVVSSVADIVAADRTLDAVFTMLPGCAAVDAVMKMLRENIEQEVGGSSSGDTRQPPPLCIVDCSTVSPTTSRRWNEIWADCGHRMFDAPVSGGVKGATAGTLTFMVGASSSDNDEYDTMESIVRPLLQQMGSNVFWCGGPGTGSATKLCNNLALAAQMVGICEAMNLGESLGVSPVLLAQVLNASTASCWSSKVNNPHPGVATSIKDTMGEGPPASREYQGGFGTKLMLKDLGLAVAAAKELGVAMPLTTTTHEVYQLATENGLGDKDFGVILEYLKTSTDL